MSQVCRASHGTPAASPGEVPWGGVPLHTSDLQAENARTQALMGFIEAVRGFDLRSGTAEHRVSPVKQGWVWEIILAAAGVSALWIVLRTLVGRTELGQSRTRDCLFSSRSHSVARPRRFDPSPDGGRPGRHAGDPLRPRTAVASDSSVRRPEQNSPLKPRGRWGRVSRPDPKPEAVGGDAIRPRPRGVTSSSRPSSSPYSGRRPSRPA